MSQRVANIDGVGEVVISKRRRSSSLRIAVSPTGKIRVGIPYWTPYAVGITFAKNRKFWINQQVEKNRLPVIKPGHRIGRHRYVNYFPQKSKKKIATRVSSTAVEIYTDLDYLDKEVQFKTYATCEKALKQESQASLVPRLQELASKHNLHFVEVKIKKLTSRWGSCSADKRISLSYYLCQLPPCLVDYVLIHELLHTKHLHHGKVFWMEMENLLPGASKLKKDIKSYKPRVEPA